mgnify:CR=1 FL=1
MAIVESLRKAVDFVMDGFRDQDDAFDYDEDYMDDGEYTEPGSNAVRISEPVTMPERKQESKVLRHPGFNQGGNEIIVMEPHSFEDVASIVEKFKDRKIVMLDLHLLDNHQSQRTIDYICGASQALGGQPKKVGDRVFVFAPHNVTLSADTPTVQNKYDTAWRTTLQ